MGLAILRRSGRSCPVVVCDACGKVVEAPGVAIVLFPGHQRDGEVVPVSIYHKGVCDPGSPQRGVERMTDSFSQELSSYLPMAMLNSNLGSKESKEGGLKLTLDVPFQVD